LANILAYFLTWTTYGTWLPGDARRWVHKRGSAEVAYQNPDGRREETARKLMRGEAVVLGETSRRLAEKTIRDTCDVKGWTLHALNVRSNHIHVVLTAPAHAPEKVMASLKAWASRTLNEAVGRQARWWTRHGSTRYLKSEQAVRGAVEYVRNQ